MALGKFSFRLHGVTHNGAAIPEAVGAEVLETVATIASTAERFAPLRAFRGVDYAASVRSLKPASIVPGTVGDLVLKLDSKGGGEVTITAAKMMSETYQIDMNSEPAGFTRRFVYAGEDASDYAGTSFLAVAA